MTAHDVLGYDACHHCTDQWVPHHLAVQTGGLCDVCFVANNKQPLRHLEIVSRTGVFQMPRRKQKATKRRTTKRERDAEKAKIAAMKRLAAIFPDFYMILLAEERADRGLIPRPKNAAPLGHEDPTGEQTRAFLALYHRLESIGEHP